MFNYNSEIFKAWVAAWIDAEGSIVIVYCNKGKGVKGHSLRVSIGQQNIKPLLEIQNYYSGSISKKKTGLYILQIISRKALNILKDILPYMIVKKRQAELAIEYYKTYETKKWKFAPVTKDEIRIRENFRLQIKALNHAFTSA